MEDYCKNYKGNCITCSNYDINDRSSSTERGFRCTHHYRPMAFDEHCPSYSYAYARGNSTIDDAIKFRVRKGYNGKPDSSYWYLISTITRILNLDAANKYLTYTKTLRESLNKYELGQIFLAYYDVHGYVLAQFLLRDFLELEKRKETIEFCQSLIPALENYCELFEEGDEDSTVDSFIEVIKLVAKRFRYYLPSIDSINLNVQGLPRDLSQDPLYMFCIATCSQQHDKSEQHLEPSFTRLRTRNK